jgi:two-component system chemotaxis sensor kinase CheA
VTSKPPLAPQRIVSIGTKLALATMTVLSVASALLFVELTDRERQSLIRAKGTAAEMVADLFAASLSAPLDFADADAIEKELDNARSNPIVTCAAVWLDAAGKGPTAPTVRGREGCAETVGADGATLRVFSDRIEVSRAVFGREGARVGRAALVFSLAAENAAYLVSRRRILVVSLVVAASTAALLILITRRQIVLPLKRITAAAKRMREGDRATRVQIDSRDEIGVLAGAFNAMSEAVADREASLEAVTQSLRELFDHMRQAICAFGPDARVHGAVSRQAEHIFGVERIEGRRVRELLFGSAGTENVDAQAFDEWVTLAFSLPVEQWPELDSLAPKLVVLHKEDGAELPLELEFRPVAQRGKIDRVMLLATDVSEKRRLERAVQTKEADHARRIAAMRKLVAGGSQVFLGFIEGARERITKCLATLGPRPAPLRTRDIDELFRHVHTIKGEARSFDLPEVESEAAKLESALDEQRALVRRDSLPAQDAVHELLKAHLARLSETIDRGSDVFVAASPIGRAALEQVTVQRSDLARLLAIAKGRSDELARVAARLVARPFGESTANLVDGAPAWAAEVSKQLRVRVDGREVGVPPALARVLGGVLTHLVRNSVAHGVELPDVRQRLGKPVTGEVVMRAEAGADGPTITVEDDGRGLDLPAIEARANALGIAPPSDGSTDLIFVSGVSTAEVGETFAGRGVGLGAVKSDLEAVGYEVNVETAPGRFTRFILRPKGGAPSASLWNHSEE